jgi:HTH-type transcriptional regulator / antitoxin HigA
VSALPQDIAEDVIEHWKHIAPVLGGRPDSAADYERLVGLMNTVLDQGGADENHPLASLADLIGDLLAAYEADSVPEPSGSPSEVLRFLMEQHGLTQSELPEIGNQSVASQVLSGKRQLNLRQVAALSKRFGVSADAFVA